MKKKKKYHIWFLESPDHIGIPQDVTADYDNYDEAYNNLLDLVHEYDDCPFIVVGCLDDNETCETMEFIENIHTEDR